MKFYKGIYLIALYDKNDELITVLDNIQEFMRYTGIPRSTAAVVLSNVSKGTQRSVIIKRKKVNIYLINMEED